MRGLSRIGGAETVWHLMNRAAQRLQIFFEDADYVQFISLLKNFCGRASVRLWAYCVMPNHYHALVQGPGEALTRCFHEVDRLWAVHHNEAKRGKGHVFQGPFLSFPQRSVGWVMRTSLYIHANPVPRLVARPEQYRWSSCRTYLGLEGRDCAVQTSAIFRMLDADDSKAQSVYRRLLDARLALKEPPREIPEEKRVLYSRAIELAQSVDSLAKALGVSREDARRSAAYYGRMNLQLSVRVLAEVLGYRPPTALSDLIYRMKLRSSKEPGFLKLLARVTDILDAPVAEASVPDTINQTL